MRILSSIDRVTLFPRGAEVVRIAAIELPAGEHRLLLDDLPASAEQSSLRVEARADGALEIIDVDSESVFVGRAERDAEERRRLEAEIRALEDQRRVLDGQRDSLDAQRALMQNLAASPLHPAARQTDEPDWAARFELIGDRLNQVHAALDRLGRERREFDEQIAELQQQLADLPDESVRRLAVSISVRAQEALKGVLQLRYQVALAGWSPLYDARLDTDDGGEAAIELVRRAMVHQNTGEDWHGVTLKLSTARPTGASSAPELPSQYLDFEEPHVYPERDRGEGMVRALAAAPKRAGPPAEAMEFAEAAIELEAEVELSGFEAVFEVPGRVDVANGGDKKLRLGSMRLPARLEVWATPQLDETAYLHAAFTPREGVALLAGKVALYRDAVYVGDGQLPHVNIGETHELGFGALHQMEVRRVEIAGSKGRQGLIKSEKTDERHYRIKIANRHDRALPVRVFERLPVARNERIRVEVLNDSSKTSEENVRDRRGVIAFHADVVPGGKAQFDLHYRISWPKDETLTHD